MRATLWGGGDQKASPFFTNNYFAFFSNMDSGKLSLPEHIKFTFLANFSSNIFLQLEKIRKQTSNQSKSVHKNKHNTQAEHGGGLNKAHVFGDLITKPVNRSGIPTSVPRTGIESDPDKRRQMEANLSTAPQQRVGRKTNLG